MQTLEAYIKIEFPDQRFITIARIEDGSICTTVENLPISGRQPQQSIWLSKESFVGMITAANIYLLKNGENVDELLKEYIKEKSINYSCSKNLNPDKF